MKPRLPAPEHSPAFLRNGGEMGGLIRAFDWARTPLGRPEMWPQSLKVATRLILSSRHPMFIWWGPELIQLYNDPWAALAGPERHPAALGARGRDTWADLWDIVGPQLDEVFSGGATWHENQHVSMVRGGRRVDTYWTYGYSPIDEEAAPGGIGGVLVTSQETTRTIEVAARHSDLYAALVQHMDEGYLLADVAFDQDGRPVDILFVETNPAAVRILGTRLTGRRLQEVSADFEPHWYEVYGRVARTGKGERLESYAHPFGSWYSYYIFKPDPAAGEGRRVAVVFQDVTERVARVRKDEAQLRLAHEAAGVGAFDWDVAGDRLLTTPEIERLYGLEPGAFHGGYDAWLDLVHPADREVAHRAVQAGLAAGAFDGEWRTIRPDGRVVWLLNRGIVERDADGTPVRMLGINVDITDRKAAEDRQTMLMAELDHRVKNVLAIVQAIARQSLGRDLGEAADRFVGRLSALSRSHTLLADNRWEGAGLHALLAEALAPYEPAAGDRLSATGADVKLGPKAAQSLSLALHELVTNAAKYGALSTGEGRLEVTWHWAGAGADRRLHLLWREVGGPAVAGPPARRSFGSRLIELTIAHDLDGEVALDFRPSGLVAEIRVPASALSVGTG